MTPFPGGSGVFHFLPADTSGMVAEVFLGCKINYNAGGTFGGRNSDAVLADDIVQMINQHDPISVTLSEVFDRKRALREVAKRTGYTLIQPERSAGHCAILLHPDATLDKSGEPILLSAAAWVGKKVAGAKKHGTHRRNELIYARYTYRNRKQIDATVHLVPSHGVALANALSKVQVRAAVVWFRTRGRLATLSGDLNETPDFHKDTLGALERIAHMLTDPKGTFGSRSIDYWCFLKRQTRKLGLRFEVRALKGFHSDHDPLLVKVYKRVNKR